MSNTKKLKRQVKIEEPNDDGSALTHDGHGNTDVASFSTQLDRFRHVPDDQSRLIPHGPDDDSKAEFGSLADESRILRSRFAKPPSSYTNLTRESQVSPGGKAKRKRLRASSRYAPPSKYAHLSPLQDVLEPGLICVFVGTNPGIRTATAGHAYAHPSNLFWKLLHSSGCTDERLRPEQDVDLPRLYSMGNTNIVERPSRDAAELSKTELAAGTPILDEKFAACRPEAACIVGKGIWEAIWRWRHGRQIRKDEFRYGWQDEEERLGKTPDWEGARVFVASSTSGLSASLRPHEKEAIWRPFGEWVRQRRDERRAALDNGG